MLVVCGRSTAETCMTKVSTPINLVKVTEHPDTTNKNMLLILESFILQKFVQRTFVPEEFQAMVAKTKACAVAVLKMKIENNSSSNTFAQLCTQSNASGKWKFVLNLLLAMEKEGASFFKDDKATMIKRKKDIIQLGQFGFFGLLDRRNMKQIELVSISNYVV